VSPGLKLTFAIVSVLKAMYNDRWVKSRLMTLKRMNRISYMAFAVLILGSIGSISAQSPQVVLTYHGDNLRTGWFSAETQLTASNVNSQSFGLLQTVVLDGRVDAEPLYVSQLTVGSQGVHNVVYVATENNSVYAIDADSGTVLWKHTFGTPVPYTYKNNDDNIYPVMGIQSTPVINRTAGVMYVVADTYNGTVDVFHLHCISLSTGKDVVTPATISFTGTLSDGTTWTFNPQYQLQRPGLLLSNNTIYIAFGSTGDSVPTQSRGAILRYNGKTLAQVTGDVTNSLDETVAPYYLSSIWQSGYALATDSLGDVYFATGNSNPNFPSFSKAWNRPESIVRLAPNLNSIISSFTPSNYFQLEGADTDVGSGGAMVLPDQPGSIPHLAVAGGKDGRAFLLNRDKMGGYTPNGPDQVLQTVDMGGCWCGPAYFVGSDNIPRVVTGGGNGIMTWQLQTAPTTQLVQEYSTGSDPVFGLPDAGGAIAVISSNGTTPGTAVVWYVQKPATSSDQNPGTVVTLQAYAAAGLQPLVSISAGTWLHAVNSNASIVPTVANGKVYVASNRQMEIFGLLTPQQTARAAVEPQRLAPSVPDAITCPSSVTPLAAAGGTQAGEHEFHGTACRASGGELRLALRNGHSIAIETSHAFDRAHKVLLTPGRALVVRATIDEKGVAHARQISPAHPFSEITPADR
jgi:hypothetical protein